MLNKSLLAIEEGYIVLAVQMIAIREWQAYLEGSKAFNSLLDSGKNIQTTYQCNTNVNDYTKQMAVNTIP